jgi:acyl-CoA hydrolase
MNRQHPYKERLVSVEEAATKVRSGDQIVDLPNASAPADLIRAIYLRWRQLKDAAMSGERPCHIGRHGALIGSFGRKTCNQGNMDATSYCFSHTDRLARNRIKPNVALMEISRRRETDARRRGPPRVFSTAATAGLIGNRIETWRTPKAVS